MFRLIAEIQAAVGRLSVLAGGHDWRAFDIGARGRGRSHPALEARVEQIAEPVTDQVDAEDHREDGEAGVKLKTK